MCASWGTWKGVCSIVWCVSLRVQGCMWFQNEKPREFWISAVAPLCKSLSTWYFISFPFCSKIIISRNHFIYKVLRLQQDIIDFMYTYSVSSFKKSQFWKYLSSFTSIPPKPTNLIMVKTEKQYKNADLAFFSKINPQIGRIFNGLWWLDFFFFFFHGREM